MIILKKDHEYFHACYNHQMISSGQINLKILKINRIPTEYLWPIYSKNLTLTSDPLSVDSYIKHPCIIQYMQDNTNRIPDLFIAEAHIYEILKNHPHPNITQYFDCIARKDRIVDLCFAKYHITLEDRLKANLPVSRDILEDIERGFNHLHNLGLIHNDINPSNIMFKANDHTSIIIDFDSCGRAGDKLMKTGIMDWNDDNFDFANIRNDYYELKRIEDAISDPIRDSSSRYV